MFDLHPALPWVLVGVLVTLASGLLVRLAYASVLAVRARVTPTDSPDPPAVASGRWRAATASTAPAWRPLVTITGTDLAYALALLAGILGKELWDGVASGVVELRVPHLLTAFIVAPLVHATLYRKLAHDEPVTLVGLSIAFQNGFFWQTIFQAAPTGPALPGAGG